MIIALHNNQRKRAEEAGSGAIGTCPWTGLKVKAKVGEIRQYWVYDGPKPELPPGYEPETEWHVNWKFPVHDDFCEVICGENREHRADIIGNENTVIEIQKSNIDIRVVRERVTFYKQHSNKRVIWVVEASDYWNKRLIVDFEKRSGENYTITWKYDKKWVLELAGNTSTNLFLDFNTRSDKLLQMWIFDKKILGKFVLKVDFFNRYYLANAKEDFKRNPNKILEIWKDFKVK